MYINNPELLNKVYESLLKNYNEEFLNSSDKEVQQLVELYAEYLFSIN